MRTTAMVALVSTMLVMSSTCAAAGAEIGFWVDGDPCVHIDSDPPENTEVHPEDCLEWLGTTEGDCIHVTPYPPDVDIRPEDCPQGAASTDWLCILVDPARPGQSGVWFQACDNLP